MKNSCRLLYSVKLKFAIVSEEAELGHFFAKLTYEVNYVVAVDVARKIKIEKIFKFLVGSWA